MLGAYLPLLDIDTEGIFRVGANADQVSEACRKYTGNMGKEDLIVTIRRSVNACLIQLLT